MSHVITNQISKNARLSCRIRKSIKDQAEIAAQLLSLSITDFAEIALEEKSKQVIADNEHILISERAFEDFVAAISSTPALPSEKLLSAVTDYQAHLTVARHS